MSLNIEILGLSEGETIPISLYSDNRLIAKTAVKGNEGKKAVSTLSIERGKSIRGRAIIEDPVLGYDNHFFFNIDQRTKPKVLAISDDSSIFLERIFAPDHFEFLNFELSTLNYSLLESQNTVILNGLKTIPNSLSNLLLDFSKNGGTLVIIPPKENMEINSYNQFLSSVMDMTFEALIPDDRNISKIAFGHPLYQNVFEKEVVNFNYPQVSTLYGIKSHNTAILSYDDGSPFLLSKGNCFVFNASLAPENSNFINSPLVVPTFYNIGEMSLKNPSLYQTIGKGQSIDVSKQLGQDNILTLRSDENEFVPLQQSYANKIRLQFDHNPGKDGIYAIMDGTDTIQNISFNYPRHESDLNYLNDANLDGVLKYSTIPNLFKKLKEETSITDYWKWFVIFALLFAVLELLIQKLLP